MSRKLIDLTGQKFGLLTVLERDFTKKDKKHSYWICQCSCENKTIKSFMGDNLRGGRVNSCGCLRHQHSPIYKDAVGEQHGLLTVLERVSPIGARTIKYKCQCECGNTIIVAINDVRSGHTSSCGCIKSKGELKISQILKNNNINFKKEYSFDDLKNINKLKFDFAIFNNNNNLIYLIEYQGEQHYKPMRYDNEDINFQERLKRDQEKVEYCLKNNIPLIRIPYTVFKTLSLEDIQLTTTKYLIKEKN